MKKIVVASMMLVFALTGCSMPSLGAKTLKTEDAKAKAIDFINNNLVQPGSKVEITEIKEEGGLFKMNVKLANGQSVVSYMTKDGTKFFPQAMDVKDVEDKNKGAQDKTKAQNDQNQPAGEVVKSDKPKVELFVMSYCPYGTQIEKGILPVANLLGKKIDFSVKFCDYSMHEEKEIDENLRQTCIEKVQPEKFNTYLNCFLQNSQADQCLTATKIDKDKLASCVSSTDKKFKVKELYKNKDSWNGSFPPFNVFKTENDKYGVKGSPTLIINGAESKSAGRDSASLLKSICSAFNKQPEECKKTLSSDAPSPGFGGGTGGSSSGGCGQ